MDESVLRAIDRKLAEGRYAEARTLLSQPGGDASRDAGLAFRLAQVCLGEGRSDEALTYAKLAAASQTGDPDIQQLLGDLQRAARQYREAIASYDTVLSARPNDPKALRGSGLVAHLLRMGAVAEQLLRLTTTVAPRDAEAWRLLGDILISTGKVGDGLEALRRAVAEDASESNYEALLFHSLTLDHSESDDRALLDQFRRLHGGRLGADPMFANTQEPERPLRVGFLSSAMRTNHNSLYFMAPLLLHHDKRRMTLHLYGDVDYANPSQAPLTGLVASVCDTTRLSDGQVAERIRADGIDVLVSALGRGSEAPRARVLRFRAAPVQVCFHHVMTTGYADADYWIGDALTVSDSEYFSERILRIPSKFAFAELNDHGPVAPLPAARNGFVTFASTTQLWKINAAVLECWSRLLNTVPSARLKIKALAFTDEVIAEWRTRCAAHGLPMERVELCPPLPDFWQHMKFYNDVDVILDTFPYGCGNSALEALWMGVPVVSLIGERFVGRQALSMLNAVGLRDFAVDGTEAYIARAAAAAADVAALERLRSALRERMRSSPLLDHASYCRSVETVIRDAWRNWCADQTA